MCLKMAADSGGRAGATNSAMYNKTMQQKLSQANVQHECATKGNGNGALQHFSASKIQRWRIYVCV